MQQRLAIAQALMMKPRILLLDEPFGALDPGIRKDMHELLLKLWRESGLTIFMVTHDLKEGFTLGSRVLVFDKVRVDQPGARRLWRTHHLQHSARSQPRRGVVDPCGAGRRRRRRACRHGPCLKENTRWNCYSKKPYPAADMRR